MSLKGGNYHGFVNEIETKLAQIEVVADALESDLSGSIADFKVEFQDLSGQVNAIGEYSTQFLAKDIQYTSTNNEEELVASFDLSGGNYMAQLRTRIAFRGTGDYIVSKVEFFLYEGGTDNRLTRGWYSVGYKQSDIDVHYQNLVLPIPVDTDMTIDLKVSIDGGLQDGGIFYTWVEAHFLKM